MDLRGEDIDEHHAQSEERAEGNPNRRIRLDTAPRVQELDQKRRQQPRTECTCEHRGQGELSRDQKRHRQPR